MYVDGHLEGPFGERRKVSGKPTLLFTASSVIKDITKCITMEAKVPGDLVYVLGETRNELGGSEYYQRMGKVGLHVPKVDAEETRPIYRSLHRAMEEGLIASAHAVTRGGLAVHLALVAMGGELGMEIDLGKVPGADSLSPARVLYSESAGRLIVTVDPGKKDTFEILFRGMKAACAGFITDKSSFSVYDRKKRLIIGEDIHELKQSWMKPFGALI
jgi:phosphoribosylformylglycinamidine synthase